MQAVGDLLREVLRIGDDHGVAEIRADHLPEHVMTDLVRRTHAYALAHAVPGDTPGWLSFDEGIEPWWRREAGLTTQEFSRVFHLRTDVVGRLAGQGLAYRPNPRSTRLYIRRNSSSKTSVAEAATLLQTLVGQQILTITGRANTVLRVEGDNVVVATARSPGGEPVPVEQVQHGLDLMREAGEVDVDVRALGHRSSFVGAVLLTLPGAVLEPTRPPRIRLTDPVTAYQLNDAGAVSAWWSGDPRQRFWLEITDRADIGVDLHCPQRDAADHRNPGYSLIWRIRHGDIVFHYSRNDHAITAWSYASGRVTEAPTIWLSHRAATRRRLQAPRPQPGWWLDLDGPFPLDEPVTLAQLRQRASEIRAVLDALGSAHEGSLYFPFFFWGGTELRPMQPYLNKMPAEVVDLFPQLASAASASLPASQQPPGPAGRGVGAPYRQAQVSPLPDTRQPFTTDPAVVERGLKGHADTQNELAHVLRQAGIEPRSRLPQEPNYDLAWEANGVVFVAEVKSITDVNEEEQLRLGLGQVLRYRHRLEQLGHARVVAVLVPERSPRDSTWRDLCHQVQVELLSRSDPERGPGLTN